MPIRNGQQYLESLRDGRQIIYKGKVIGDVTTEPGFRNTARTIAQFYDFQSQPQLKDLMTYETDDGDQAGMAFIEPRSKEDLRKRGQAYSAWAEIHCGLLGRSPDYMNSFIMGVGAAKHKFGEKDPVLAERAYKLYLDARKHDLCMTHTLLQPHVDRTKPASELPTMIRIVKETSDGIVVSGARSIATLAPFCNTNLSMQVNQPKLKAGEEDLAISFVVDVNSPGLKWICRDSYDQEQDYFDAPISSNVDEMDCIAIFDNCLIPWENVFIYKDIDIFNKPGQIVKLDAIMVQQVLMKNIAKTRFMLGLAHLIAETIQINTFFNIQERLGEFVIYLSNLEALAIAAVEGAIQDPVNKLWYLNPKATVAALRLYPEYYEKMVSHFMQIGASGYIGSPQEKTLDILGESIEKYFSIASLKANEKVGLFRLAWDLIGSNWGGRQQLYERFFSGDNTLRKTLCYTFADKKEAMEMVKRVLNFSPTPEQSFKIPEKYNKS